MIGICVIVGKQTHSFAETRGDRMVFQRDSKWCNVFSTEESLPEVVKKNQLCMNALARIVAQNTHEAQAWSDEYEMNSEHEVVEKRLDELEKQICGILNDFLKENKYMPFPEETGVLPQNTKCCYRLNFKFTDTLEKGINNRILRNDNFLCWKYREVIRLYYEIESLESKISSLQYDLKKAQESYKGTIPLLYDKIGLPIMEELNQYLDYNPELYNTPLGLEGVPFKDIFCKSVPIVSFRGVPIAQMRPLDVALMVKDRYFINKVILNGGLDCSVKFSYYDIRDILSFSLLDLEAFKRIKTRYSESYLLMCDTDSSFRELEVLHSIEKNDKENLSSIFRPALFAALKHLSDTGIISRVLDTNNEESHYIINENDIPVSILRDRNVGMLNSTKEGLKIAKTRYKNFPGFYNWLLSLSMEIEYDPYRIVVYPKHPEELKCVLFFKDRLEKIVELVTALEQDCWGLGHSYSLSIAGEQETK